MPATSCAALRLSPGLKLSVVVVLTARDAAHAVALANISAFGLGAAVWNSGPAQGEAITRQLQSGAVFINGLVKSMPELPFGEIKESGYGRGLSYLGLREFVQQKSIWTAKEPTPNHPKRGSLADGEPVAPAG